MVARLAPRPSNRHQARLGYFLSLSLALHAALLYLLQPAGLAPSPATLALSVTLRTQQRASIHAEQKSAVAVRQAARTEPTRARAPVLVGRGGIEGPAPTPAAPSINLQAALTTARAYGHEQIERKSLVAPKPLLTVETAIARATTPDTLIETRGAAGEYVTLTGKMRCVTPLVVPHFLEGKTMLTQCEVRKG